MWGMNFTQMNPTIIAVVIGVLLLGGVYYLKTMPASNTETGTDKSQSFTSITPAEFAKKAESKDVTVIDIRTPEEIVEGKVATDALELDYYSADFKNQLAELDKEQSYLIYCRSGNRSGDTLRLMKSLGFTDVSDLKGGKVAWEQSGRELVVPSVLVEEDPVVDTGNDNELEELVACPADAKLCADGTAVGRTGPNCEFPEC